MRFPELAGEDLTGRALAFPRDFGVRTVALVAFAVEARDEAASWVPFLDTEVARRDDRRARLFALAPKAMRLMKGAIVQALRAGAASGPQREATVLAFASLDAICTALDIRTRGGVHVFVVDPDGTVLARAAGPFAEEAATVIRKTVA